MIRTLLAHINGWRLSTRIVLLSLGLLLLLQAASFTVIRAGIESNARTELLRELGQGERVWRRLVDQRAQKLQQGAALLAADYGFRSAVASDDTETIGSALENNGARIGASFVALLDTRMTLRARSAGNNADIIPVLGSIAGTLAREGGAIAMVGERAWQFVMVPLKAPVVIGWVVMGFPLDQGVLDEMRAVSGLHVVLLADTPGEHAETLSTLPAPTAGWDVLRAPASAINLDGEPWVKRRVVLGGQDATPAASSKAAVVTILLGSVAQAIAPYRALQVTLAVISIIGLILFAAGSIFTAHRVAQPLLTLLHASERLAQGHYDEKPAHTNRRDEIGELAKAFDHMRISIASQQHEIRQLAFWDRMTGLPNRVQFRDAVHQEIERSRRSGKSLAVLMLDLDRFKHVNDVLGYAMGDRLLQAVAARLQSVARDGDLVARLGGDEFALMMPGGDVALAQIISQKLSSAFEQPLTLDDQTVDLSAGIGIACWPQHAPDADLLLSRAEVAMYAAKRQTAGATVYDPKKDSSSALTLSLLSELRHALDNEELRLYLQPKIALASGMVSSAEALMRWQHPLRGLVPPMDFIPFAEQTGFIRRLTLWMFESCARNQAELNAAGITRVSINLSTRDLLDQEFPDKLDALLQTHRASAAGFCLEITESAIMDDPQRAEQTLNRLAAQGFKLSIDDFGTGYSSLAYLKKLPVNELKIDKSFVMAMTSTEGDAKIVRSTIDLAHNLGLSVVAEGVENEQIATALAALSCDEAQGYHYSKPVPLVEFLGWAAQWRTQQSSSAQESIASA